MARLTKKQRSALPDKDFALLRSQSGKKIRMYPIPDLAHAIAALGRARQHATPWEKSKIYAKIWRRYKSLRDDPVLAQWKKRKKRP